MCGIFTLFSHSLNTNEYNEIWNSCANILYRRGPDSTRYVQPSHCAFLGGTRLSIVDADNKKAFNIMSSPEGRYHLAYNGEIYNFRKLRSLAKDWTYSTDSDTEVLLALLITYGYESASNMIEGMFAFVIYDNLNDTVYAAVDQGGQKPLYYRLLNGGLVLASDMRALMIPQFPSLTLSKEALREALYFRFIMNGRTQYKEIFRFTPGQQILFRNHIKYKTTYKPIPVAEKTYRDGKEATASIQEALFESVNLTLGDSNEIAIFLSGGIDSMAVSVAAKKFGKKLQTYSIGFEDVAGPIFSDLWYADEFRYSRLAANALESQHYEYRMSMKEYFDIFELWCEIQTDPILVLDAIPILKLSQIVSQDFKYVLSGSGSDEIFDGYQMGTLTDCSELTLKSDSLDSLIKNYLLSNSRAYGANLVELFMDSTEWRPETDSIKNSLSSFNLNSLSFFTIAKLLMCYGRRAYYEFAMLDRTAMHYSLETRNPFAQSPIVHEAMALPEGYHQIGGHPKGILRNALVGHIPDEIRLRPKAPFVMPSSYFFSNEFIQLTEPLLKTDSLLLNLELVNRDYLIQLWKSEVPSHRAIFPRLVQLERLLRFQSN
jgi:asparagine synthase (glutamine-hydrolysing)